MSATLDTLAPGITWNSEDSMKLDEVVAKILAARDLKKRIKEDYEAKAGRLDEAIAKLEVLALSAMEKMGVESVRTEHGTAYKNTVTYTSVADWDAVLTFIKQTGNWQLLQRAVAKKEVEAFMAESNDAVPGVNLRREVVVNVRRS